MKKESKKNNCISFNVKKMVRLQRLQWGQNEPPGIPRVKEKYKVMKITNKIVINLLLWYKNIEEYQWFIL